MTPHDFKPLWTIWRCRSNANLFMLSLAGFFISLLVIGLIIRSGFYQHLLPVLPVVAVYFAIWTVKTYQRMRALRNARPECGPLSRDELRKARSKLVKDRKGV
jgi:hypothetical protein